MGGATLCGFLSKTSLSCARLCRRAGSSEDSFLLQTAVLEDHCERETLRCALRVNESLWARTLKVPRFLGDPAAALRKVLTNFSRATSSDEAQYTAGHLAVCAAAKHEERNVDCFRVGSAPPPRGHLTFMWKPSKISQQELIGGEKMNEFFSFLPLSQSGRVKRILLRL